MATKQYSGLLLALNIERNLRKDWFDAIKTHDLEKIAKIEQEMEDLDYLIEQAYLTFTKFHVQRNTEHWEDIPK